MKTILIIEDVAEARKALCRTLETNGYAVLTAPNGKVGLCRVQDEAVDLVLTDILMPEMEGLETIKAIVKSYPGLPIIAMTGSLSEPFLQAALAFGAVSGLTKPFPPASLLSQIHDALANKIDKTNGTR